MKDDVTCEPLQTGEPLQTSEPQHNGANLDDVGEPTQGDDNDNETEGNELTLENIETDETKESENEHPIDSKESESKEMKESEKDNDLKKETSKAQSDTTVTDILNISTNKKSPKKSPEAVVAEYEGTMRFVFY